MLLYIVRHGEPDYATDSLTPRGILQAEAAAKRLAAAGIDRIFSSPMGRARQTAEPLCRLLNKAYTVEDWTHEIGIRTDFPDGNPKSIALVQNTCYRKKDLWQLGAADALEHPAFSETDMAQCKARIEKEGNAFLERFGYREEKGNYRILCPNEERIVLFCHGNFARVWLSCLLKVPLHIMLASFGANHTGVTILQFKNQENGWTAPRCLCFSDNSHTYAHGPDMLYNGKFPL